MCLIVFGYSAHPNYRLVFAANRDERYERPTRGAQFWNSHPNILAGKDLEAGGTWMGISRTGKFSAVTNYRDPSITKEDPPSRGKLTLNFLINKIDPLSYLQQLHQEADNYQGFNLLTGNINTLGYYSNQEGIVRSLSPGIYGLSNHLLNTPWPKVQRSKNKLSHILNKQKVSTEALFDLLGDDVKAPEDQLPDTGIPKEVEKEISPIFIKGEEYGTRCSTVLLIDKHNTVTFIERRYKPATQEVKEENSFEFEIKIPQIN